MARVGRFARLWSQPRTRFLGLLGLVLIAAVLVVGIAAINGPGIRQDGPLRTNSTTNVEFGLLTNQPASWGVHLPDNPTDSDITFVSADLVEPVGLSILGVAMNRPNTGGIVSVYGYPPAGMEVFPVETTTLPARGRVQVVVGFQLAEGSSEGAIKGVLVRYVVDGQTYEIMLEYSLRIFLKTE
jgi:hypothetical protein